MSITFSGNTGIEFCDETVKESAFYGYHEVGSYVFADTNGQPNISQDILWGTIARGDELYGTDRAGSRDSNPVSTSETLWQAAGFSTNSDRGVLWRRVK